MILGISASPRLDGVTSNAIKYILDATAQPFEYISLAGKTIGSCRSCLGCAVTNRCVLRDDFQNIAEKILQADALVFGAPNYYNGMNSLAHCFWERSFCFRHSGIFELAGKPTVLLATGYSASECDNPVLKQLAYFAASNKLEVISSLAVNGVSQCYDCIPGRACAVGNVVKDHGVVAEITAEMRPPSFADQPAAQKKAVKAGIMLSTYLKEEKE